MSPRWASPTLFTYRVQTIPEGLLGVERKALYPQLRQRCQCNVFQLLLTFRWLKRKKQPKPGGDKWRMSLRVHSPTPTPTPRVKVHYEQPRALADGMMLAPLGPCQPAVRWSKCWIPHAPGALGPGRVEALSPVWGPRALSPRADLSGTCQVSLNVRLRNWLAPYAARSYGVPKPCAAQPDRCRPGSCHAGCRRSACPSRGCGGDGPWCGAAPAARPSIIRAGRAEKTLLALLRLTCGLLWGSPCDFWGLSQRHGASSTTHTWKERSSIPIAGVGYERPLRSALQPNGICCIAYKFPSASQGAPRRAWALLPLGTQNTLSWCGLSWCSQQRLNKEKWKAFNTSLHHLWSLGEVWVTALMLYTRSMQMLLTFFLRLLSLCIHLTPGLPVVQPLQCCCCPHITQQQVVWNVCVLGIENCCYFISFYRRRES